MSLNRSDYIEILHRVPTHALHTLSWFGQFNFLRSDIDKLLEEGWLAEYKDCVYFTEDAIRNMIDAKDGQDVIPPDDCSYIPLLFIPTMELAEYDTPPAAQKKPGLWQRLVRWRQRWLW